ncbi:unnamed protein product [Spodoptera littoralis]|uniref:Uncharacterized protein n=1 Tax=Spodoptera littoralis TaxID=7109 RepID=A0A9P0MWS9_SPOLI|nr:unnamed protein product [Spodoptera littoralis]CAH1636258.1 unnamed protein product [Spodoptera littoralis]
MVGTRGFSSGMMALPSTDSPSLALRGAPSLSGSQQCREYPRRVLTELFSLLRDARYVSTSGSGSPDFFELLDARIEESSASFFMVRVSLLESDRASCASGGAAAGSSGARDPARARAGHAHVHSADTYIPDRARRRRPASRAGTASASPRPRAARRGTSPPPSPTSRLAAGGWRGPRPRPPRAARPAPPAPRRGAALRAWRGPVTATWARASTVSCLPTRCYRSSSRPRCHRRL